MKFAGRDSTPNRARGVDGVSRAIAGVALSLSCCALTGCLASEHDGLSLRLTGMVGFPHDHSHDYGASSYSSSGSAYAQSDVPGGGGYTAYAIESIDTRWRGYGAQLAASSPLVDLLVGYDRRQPFDDWLPEFSFGLRKRLSVSTPLVPYVYALARVEGQEPEDRQRFHGSDIGFGFELFASQHWFFDLQFGWEWTTRLPSDNGDSSLKETVLQLGVGWAF